MKRRLILAAPALLLPYRRPLAQPRLLRAAHPTTPTFAFLPGASITAQSGANGTGLSSAIDTRTAKFIAAIVVDLHPSSSVFSDTQTNAWTAATVFGSAPDADIRIMYCNNPSTSATHQFQAAGTTTFAAIAVMAFTDTATPSASIDQNNGASNTLSATINTGSVTPSQNSELLIIGLGGQFATATVDIGSGTEITAPYSAGAFWAVGMAYQIQTTATTRNPLWTANTNVRLCATIGTFKP